MVREAPNHFRGTGAWHGCVPAGSPPAVTTPLPGCQAFICPSPPLCSSSPPLTVSPAFLSSPAQAPLNLGFTLYYLYILFLYLGLISRQRAVLWWPEPLLWFQGPPTITSRLPCLPVTLSLFSPPWWFSFAGPVWWWTISGCDVVNESRPMRVFRPGASVGAAAKRSSFSRSCWTSESLWGPGLPTLRILSENKAA